MAKKQPVALRQAQVLISGCKGKMLGFKNTELSVQLLNFEKRYKKLADALTFVGLHLSTPKDIQDELIRLLPELKAFEKKVEETKRRLFSPAKALKVLVEKKSEGWVIPLMPLYEEGAR